MDAKPTLKDRAEILDEAKRLTCGPRNTAYGDPIDQLGCAGHLKIFIREQLRASGVYVHPAELEAIDMVLTKISRRCWGENVPLDTYVDMAAYSAIGGQAYAQLCEQRRPSNMAEEPDSILKGY